MKTIEEASKEYSKTRNEEKEIQYILDMEAFKKGVEFAQEWIPIEQEYPPHMMEVLAKDTYTPFVAKWDTFKKGWYYYDTQARNWFETNTKPKEWRPTDRK